MNLHIATQKCILVDVTNILNILLTDMTWAIRVAEFGGTDIDLCIKIN